MSTAKLMKITITYEYENEETKARLFLIYFSTIYQLGFGKDYISIAKIWI
jgi:hypothetical protein